MSATVLVLNAGSSSVKYRLIDERDTTVCDGLVERIGTPGARIHHRHGDATLAEQAPVDDHAEAMALVVSMFDRTGPDLGGEDGPAAVGHRVVMGGRRVRGPEVIDDALVADIERLVPLAPLHNPPGLTVIALARRLLPHRPQVAVFDTAFFVDLPEVAATYAIDRELADEHGVRRYGFHGISHEYVSTEAARIVGPRGARRGDGAALRQIVLHLGNGASASAIVGGRPVDTSMGLTPLEGLVMGSRGGDIDPGVLLHLARSADLSIDELDELLNHRSGLMGLAGTNDLRDVHRLIADGDPGARRALNLYVWRLKKYIGAYAAVMGGLDVLTFTAGVGENDPVVRAETTAGLEHLGIHVDPERNARREPTARAISADGAAVEVLVIPTDEELAIARQARHLVTGR